MNTLVYATGSAAKFTTVKRIMEDQPLRLEQVAVIVDEIQSDDLEKIARRKALDAYAHVKKPLFVTDTFWSIPALNGFPGAYMKEVNQWFKPDDFLNLMREKDDRRIIARDCIVFTDGDTVRQFFVDLEGSIAQTPYQNVANSLDAVTLFGGKYLAEYNERGEIVNDELVAWTQFKTFIRDYFKI